MMRRRSLLGLLALCASVAFCKPTSEKKERVHHSKDLDERDPNDQNGFQFDHDAFMGRDGAQTFDQLTPEESKERLGKIVDRIDHDQDGLVTADELTAWIKRAQNRYVDDNVKKHWNEYDANRDGQISWEEYRNATYGFHEDETFSDVSNDEDKASYRKMLRRDVRRFEKADKDGDKVATREEFTAFLHPEEFDYMKPIVVLETIEDIDKDGDGMVDEKEYVGDMYTPEEGEPEPDWVKNEQDQFRRFRDLNKDGKMDKEEVERWILPGDYDHAMAEAKHLIHESDKDEDSKLTKQEIVNNWNMFVGSQVTNYGEDLTRKHDEF